MVGSARYYGVGKEGGKRRGGAGTSDGDETNYGSMTIMNKVGQNYLLYYRQIIVLYHGV